MKAWQVTRLGQPAEALDLVDLPDPEPGRGQLLVRVTAAALSYPDALLCRGEYQVKPPLPFTLGVESAGVVVATGPGTDGWEPGQRVLGTLGAGGLAEHALFDAANAFRSPAKLDDAEAAALHMNHQTAHFALHHRARLVEGETVLVHAGVGGVGSATIQLARAANARVIAVVGGAAKAAVARDLGAHVVVDRHADDFVAIVKDDTNGRGADVIVDPVGGDTFTRSTKCVAFDGRIVVVGFTSGAFGRLATNHALVKNYGVLGLHWGLYRQHAPDLIARVQSELEGLIDADRLRPLVTERLPMADAPDGVTRLSDGTTIGRVVVEPQR